jgi:uncharacterized protein
MTDTSEAGLRIGTLDIVRGVAVMGILAMNIVAFGMPETAYINPTAYGTESPADLASWAFNFILIDGRMRGLFSFLFGASMLLVIERAEAAEASPAIIHYRRMLWLLVFGLIHYYFIWWGDILSLYAPVGMIAFAFRRSSPKTLIHWAIGLILVQLALFTWLAFSFHAAESAATAPGASAGAIHRWASKGEGLGPYAPATLAEILARYRGDYAGIVRHMLHEDLKGPLRSLAIVGWETLAYMLLGMAALKTGFLTGAWSKPRLSQGGAGRFRHRDTSLRRPRLADRPGEFLGERARRFCPRRCRPGPAADDRRDRGPGHPAHAQGRRTGKADCRRRPARPFTNYLGTKPPDDRALLNGWGFGQFGRLSRIELWIPVVATWALMLLWSKPWLDRFRYGPFEWLWRSLARWRLQPMRRGSAPGLERRA